MINPCHMLNRQGFIVNCFDVFKIKIVWRGKDEFIQS